VQGLKPYFYLRFWNTWLEHLAQMSAVDHLI